MTVAVLLCASLAARGAALVPARTQAAVVFDGDAGVAGMREFLEAAGTKSRALSPREVSGDLAALVGADLLSGAPGWGLDRRGIRALVVAGAAYGLSAPVRDGKAARKALLAWVSAAGPWSKRHGTRTPVAAGSGRSQRAGIVAPQGGSLRLFTASGRGAEALVTAFRQIGAKRSPSRALSSDKRLGPLLAEVAGTAAVIVRGDDPITYSVLDLLANRSGIVARGVVGARSPLLDGHAPDASGCAGAVLFCLRASLGPSGQAAFALAVQTYFSWTSAAGPLPEFVRREAPLARALLVKSDGLDVGLLGEPETSLWALHLVAAVAGTHPREVPADLKGEGPRSRCLHAEGNSVQYSIPCADARADLRDGDGPALQATADPAALDASLSRLSALDAFRGSVPAAFLGARLLAGGFLRGSGPFTLTGDPDPLGARIELRLPLR
ncbi:MAG: hypothetical protein ACJ79O_04020 [Myxococcales bacterium]